MKAASKWRINLESLTAGIVLVGLVLVSSAYLVRAASPAQLEDEGRIIYEQMCQSCHTIGGGRLVGPDLAGVIERRERGWLEDFITAPDRVLASDDPLAAQLLAEYNNLTMPNLGLSQGEVDAVLAYFESQGEGVATAEVSLPPGNADRGKLLFTGQISMENGGPPCMACHNVANVGEFGGGSLGPDLTQVYDRMGEVGLSGALSGLPFPTMRGVYEGKSLTLQEQADLLAIFAQSDVPGILQQGAVNDAVYMFGGVLGAVVLFGVMFIFWPRQRHSVTENLRRNS